MKNQEIKKNTKYLTKMGTEVFIVHLSEGFLEYYDVSTNNRGRCVSVDILCVSSKNNKEKYPEYFL